tara:strand:- start:11529 stop:12560 length:1032 start_codon:yes stop_codon:yes gene_type:complete
LGEGFGSPPFHFVKFKNKVFGLLCIAAALIVVFFLSLSIGAVDLDFSRIIDAIFLRADKVANTIFWDLRFPRSLGAILVGASLGMSGALLQGMLRNGLASPFLLGISAGAGLVVVVMITLGSFPFLVPLGAWLGALATTALVFLLAKTRKAISVPRLILGGVAFSSLFGAIQSTLLLFSDDGKIQAALTWLIGSLNSRGWDDVSMAAPWIIPSLVVGCFLGKQLNLLSLGDEMAQSLGVSLLRSRIIIGACAALLTASAVSIAGLVGFVGLIVPHGVRFLVGDDNRLVLPGSALGGAMILSLSDLIARSGPVEIPVGIVTALLGAPTFIFLLYSSSRTRRQAG